MIAGAACANAEGYLDRSKWVWSASSTCAPDGSDIAGISGLYDGDISTCWHSNWHAASGSAERSNPHWIMIDRGTDTSEFSAIAYTPRQLNANQSCTSYCVYIADKDLSYAPSTSLSAIVQALGVPELSGTWEGNTEEKIARFEKPTSARYILFVNVESAGSSSAACAELNLIGEGGSPNPSKSAYNAISIVRKAQSEPDRIAIQGNALTFTMNQGWLRMSNTDITVEYDLADVKSFKFEKFDFADGQAYTGTQKDVLTSTFNLGVVPAPATVKELSGLAIVPPAATHLNRAVEGKALLTYRSQTIAEFSADRLDSLRSADGSYPLLPAGLTDKGDYELTIPAELFILADGSRSLPFEAKWTVDPETSIAAPEAATLVIGRRGGTLTVSGISGAETIMLFDLMGRRAAAASVSADGRAALNVAALPAGVYLLNVNNSTLKITL